MTRLRSRTRRAPDALKQTGHKIYTGELRNALRQPRSAVHGKSALELALMPALKPAVMPALGARDGRPLREANYSLSNYLHDSRRFYVFDSVSIP